MVWFEVVFGCYGGVIEGFGWLSWWVDDVGCCFEGLWANGVMQVQ